MKNLPFVSAEFVRQRRAVYHGLCTVLTETEAAAALVVWSEHFSDPDSAFSGLNSFVRDVSSSFDKVGQQREMLHAISKALVTKPEDLRQAPPVDSEQEVNAPIAEQLKPALPTAASTEGGANETPEFQSFCTLLLALLRLIDQQHAALSQHFREYIKEVVNDLPWSEAQQEQLIKFVDTENTVQLRAYRDGQLKALFGHLRVWMEHKLEKKVSASLIERAMTDAGRAKTANLYSPKLFF